MKPFLKYPPVNYPPGNVFEGWSRNRHYRKDRATVFGVVDTVLYNPTSSGGGGSKQSPMAYEGNELSWSSRHRLASCSAAPPRWESNL